MKKIILPLFLYAGTFSAMAQPAQIENGGFETWTKVLLFEHPSFVTATMSSNYDTYFDNGELNVFERDYGENKVLRIENIQGTNEVHPGYFIFGKKPDGSGVFEGGFPVDDPNISGVAMRLSYDMKNGSEGFVMVQFKNQDQPVGQGNYGPGTYFFPITGSLYDEVVEFHFDEPLGATPDRCIMAFASGDVMNSDSPFELGSFMEIDDLKLLGTENEVPNADFMSWGQVEPVMVPKNCVVKIEPFDANFSKSVERTQGYYALKLTTKTEDGVTDIGEAIMGDKQDGVVVPNIVIDQEADIVSFQYKYQSVNDKAEAHFTFFQQEGNSFVPIWEKSIMLEPNEDFEMVEYNFREELQSNFTDASYMAVCFKSSCNRQGVMPEAGSTLILDDVQFSGTSGFADSFLSLSRPKGLYAYPNPTIGRVQISFFTPRSGYYRVFSPSGIQIDLKEFSNVKDVVYDLAGRPAGKYIFRFYHEGGSQVARVIKY